MLVNTDNFVYATDKFKKQAVVVQNYEKLEGGLNDLVQLRTKIENDDDKIQATKLRYGSNYSAGGYLNKYLTKKWADKHHKRHVDALDISNQEHLLFAKELFESWDLSGDGWVSEDEVIRPLISLGLASDPKSVIKVWRALKPQKKPG